MQLAKLKTTNRLCLNGKLNKSNFCTIINIVYIVFCGGFMKEEMPYIELIKQIMHDYNLSQLKFASIIGVNQTTVSQWLLGRKKPTYDCIYSICVNFNVSPNLFFGLEN